VLVSGPLYSNAAIESHPFEGIDAPLTRMGNLAVKFESVQRVAMASSKRKATTVPKDVQDEAEYRRMFLEYREENARDMGREAYGAW
jgi:hypothetical protein